MRNIKQILKENIVEYIFLFLLNSKIKYTCQTHTVNHIFYKIHKPTTFDLNMKIIIATVTQYKMQVPFLGCS